MIQKHVSKHWKHSFHFWGEEKQKQPVGLQRRVLLCMVSCMRLQLRELTREPVMDEWGGLFMWKEKTTPRCILWTSWMNNELSFDMCSHTETDRQEVKPSDQRDLDMCSVILLLSLNHQLLISRNMEPSSPWISWSWFPPCRPTYVFVSSCVSSLEPPPVAPVSGSERTKITSVMDDLHRFPGHLRPEVAGVMKREKWDAPMMYPSLWMVKITCGKWNYSLTGCSQAEWEKMGSPTRCIITLHNEFIPAVL